MKNEIAEENFLKTKPIKTHRARKNPADFCIVHITPNHNIPMNPRLKPLFLDLEKLFLLPDEEIWRNYDEKTKITIKALEFLAVEHVATFSFCFFFQYVQKGSFPSTVLNR